MQTILEEYGSMEKQVQANQDGSESIASPYTLSYATNGGTDIKESPMS